MKLKSHETKLIGKIRLTNGKITDDETVIRINELTKNYLTKIVTNNTTWETLYQDPDDGRYWVLVYPQSYLHGGVAPTLVNINKASAILKFDLK